MQRLILFRHAKAAPDRDAPDDRARMLTERGREDARDAGVALASRDLQADVAVVSTAARTRETWALASGALGDIRTEFREPLYMAEPETIWNEALRTRAGRVLIVGHNPGLHTLAALLIDQTRDRSGLARALLAGMAPAAWAAFAVGGDALEGASASLIDAWSPKAG